MQDIQTTKASRKFGWIMRNHIRPTWARPIRAEIIKFPNYAKAPASASEMHQPPTQIILQHMVEASINEHSE
jgi:hypothetical protein